jgi:hypothetical protein
MFHFMSFRFQVFLLFRRVFVRTVRRPYRIFCGAALGRFSLFPSGLDPGARYSVDSATPRNTEQHQLHCLVSSSSRVGSCRHGRGDGCSDAGGHCSSGGTSGAAGASPRPLVFSSGIAQFDELLDGGARTRCHLCAGRPACGLLWAGAILHSMHPAFFASCIPATAAFQNVNDKSVFSFHAVCIPCSLHHAYCIHMHTAFLHYAFHTDPQLRSRRPKLHSALHVSHLAFHKSCIPHLGSLTVAPGCAGTLHRCRA